MCSLDTFLNHLEFLCYLEKTGHLQPEDRDAIFKYWLDVLAVPHNAGMRRYLARFGFENLVAAIPKENVRDTIQPGVEHVVFYGSLTRRGGRQMEAGVEELLEFRGKCSIPGKLYDLGDYPGLVEGEGSSKGRYTFLRNTRYSNCSTNLNAMIRNIPTRPCL